MRNLYDTYEDKSMIMIIFLIFLKVLPFVFSAGDFDGAAHSNSHSICLLLTHPLRCDAVSNITTQVC